MPSLRVLHSDCDSKQSSLCDGVEVGRVWFKKGPLSHKEHLLQTIQHLTPERQNPRWEEDWSGVGHHHDIKCYIIHETVTTPNKRQVTRSTRSKPVTASTEKSSGVIHQESVGSQRKVKEDILSQCQDDPWVVISSYYACVCVCVFLNIWDHTVITLTDYIFFHKEQKWGVKKDILYI